MARVARALIVVCWSLLAVPASAAGQITLFDHQDRSLGLSGYVRALTGVHDQGFDVPGASRRSGFHGEVVRLKWQLRSGSWVVDAHNRLQARVASGGGGTPVAGFGVSRTPARSVDLRSDLVSAAGIDVWHDIDRLSLTVYTPAADLTLGRQPITWGVSAIFPVADLWAQFSPFELDTEEKPGIDAVRALFYPAERLEVDAVVADRGSLEDLSAGVRATLGLSSADVWMGAGKLWSQIMAMGGITVLLDEVRLRVEAVLPWELEREGDALDDPRVTLGADWIRGRLALTGEYHFNGLGAADPAGYLERLGSESFGRGESYYLGRHYLGAGASWAPDEQGRLHLALSALVNADDGSAAFTPTLSWDAGPATSLSAGSLISVGQKPALVPPAGLRSEFGAYGRLWFTRLSVYF